MHEARTIDEVLQQLDQIIAWCRQNNSRLGYFPALYRKVTLRVKEGIADNFFEDGSRMERLDVLFAKRYLTAFDARRNGKPATKAWEVAFNASHDRWAIVLQHLLLGINAHINLDLGIAAAETAPGHAIHGLKTDFERINQILASLVDDVQSALTNVWPMLRLLDWIAGRDDEKVINFSIDVARRSAWLAATHLAFLDGAVHASAIVALDEAVASVGDSIQHPGPIVGTVTHCIRLGERGAASEIISILQEI